MKKVYKVQVQFTVDGIIEVEADSRMAACEEANSNEDIYCLDDAKIEDGMGCKVIDISTFGEYVKREQPEPKTQKTIDQINAMIRNVEDSLVDMKALVAGMMGE